MYSAVENQRLLQVIGHSIFFIAFHATYILIFWTDYIYYVIYYQVSK